jgi:type 1 fimbriae regulatory protein FimE
MRCSTSIHSSSRICSIAIGLDLPVVHAPFITRVPRRRVSELCALTWDQIDFSQGMMHVRRIKNGIGSVQQIGGEEMRMLRALKREDGNSRYVFMTERGAPMTPAGFRKFLSRLAVAAKFQFPVHPHMLRHACGYKLANDGRDTRALQHYLGHKNIMHIVRYTELSPERFKNFWED